MALSLVSRRILCARKNVFLTSCRNGYIILLPEVPADLPDDPLLKLQGIPNISSLTEEKCSSIVKKLSLDFESVVWAIEENLKDKPVNNIFEDVLDPLEVSGAHLDTTWGLVKTLYLTRKDLMPFKTYINIHDQARRSRASKFNNASIYIACKEASVNTSLTEEQERVIGKYTLECQLNGLALGSRELKKFSEVTTNINKEKSTIQTKAEIATKMFQHTISDYSFLRDFPEEALRVLALDSSQPRQGPWKVTLYPHVYSQFMEYCPDRDLRWNTWQAHTRRCSKHSGTSGLETSIHIEELRFLRNKQAEYLGFNSFAEMSMQTKMAANVNKVKSMIESLLSRAFQAQEREIAELQDFSVSRGFDGAVQLWDVPYWRRKQCNALFGYDEKKVSEYFPLPQVLAGLFKLCEQLFGVYIVKQEGVVSWHSDVHFYNILESDSREPVAGLYFDPYGREEKLSSPQTAGWMVALRGRSSVACTTPLASLIFNFSQPQDGKPTLLSFSDLQLLFKKFGHALQHLLTKASYMEVSGLSNIEWDAVEVCSNFMVHWLYDKNTIALISGHVENGEPLPESMLETLCKVEKHLAGFDLCRELYLSSLDLEVYSSNDFWKDIVQKLWPQYLAFPLDGKDSHPCSFTPIFCEEWAAAYYCHTWARVVAADAFSAFLEAGLDNKDELSSIGKRFRKTFLALGGGCHPGEVFRRFRGRDPSSKALLNSLGFKKQIGIEKQTGK